MRRDGENGQKRIISSGRVVGWNDGLDGGDERVGVYVCWDMGTKVESEKDERDDGMWKWISVLLRCVHDGC